MERPKQVHAQVDERHQRHAADAEHGGIAGARPRVPDGPAQQQVAYIKEKEEQRGVRRASQAHHVPQTVFPQIGPVVSTIAANTVPTSADASAKRSRRGSFRNRNTTLATPTSTIASSVHTAAGTWR